MKIAIDARMIEMSGIGTVLQKCIGAGIYDVALGEEADIKKYSKSLQVIPYKQNIYGINEQLHFPYKKLRIIKPDVLHVPHYNVPLFYKGKLIVTINDLTHIVLPEFLPNKLAYVYAKVMYWVAAHKATHIITISENTKKDIVEMLNIAPEKVSVIYLAADETFCVKKKETFEYLYKKYKIPKNKKIILYVGNLKPHKNLHRLLKALNKMQSKEDVILLLVGKVFDSINIELIKEKHGLNGKVLITGSVSKEELIDLYNCADLFAFTSLYEGFGLPPLEAMACGTPVICSNNSSLPEVVGDAALQFDPYNIDEIAQTIDKVILNEEISSNLIKRGFERVKQFSWDNTIHKFEKVLYAFSK